MGWVIMEKVRNRPDILFHDDASDQIRRKVGRIRKIEDGLIFFDEFGKIEIIPIFRVIRIEKGDGQIGGEY